MSFLNAVIDQVKGFFGYQGLLDIIRSGDYGKFLTWDGFGSLMGPVLPLLLVAEMVRAGFYKRFKVISYKISFFSYVLNAFIGRVLAFAMVGICIGLFQKYALFQLGLTWYWFIVGYVIWEFSHFVYHYLAHKVRILWCLHSTHHAPEAMNLSISYAHFFLEAPYADFIRTSICILLGVPPTMLFVILFIDGFWGTFIHVGENIMKDARLGFLGRIILTPSHHRVHHARNPKYMDTNFCNLLNVWDHVFRTYQPEDMEMPIEYGITRKMKPHSFLDAYFGEIILLGRDVAKAPGIKNKLLYIIMPPGWSHTGEHKTGSMVRKAYMESVRGEPTEVVEKPVVAS